MHEVKDNEHELHRGEHNERRDNQPLYDRKVDQHDLDAGNNRQNHRDLDIEMKFARLVVAGDKGGSSGCGGCGHGQ